MRSKCVSHFSIFLSSPSKKEHGIVEFSQGAWTQDAKVAVLFKTHTPKRCSNTNRFACISTTMSYSVKPIHYATRSAFLIFSNWKFCASFGTPNIHISRRQRHCTTVSSEDKISSCLLASVLQSLKDFLILH